MTLEELVARCKAGVSLEINEHRNYYETIEQHISNDDSLGAEDRQRLIAGGQDSLYRLQFYPHTPIGFYAVIGTTLQEVLDRAEEVFRGSVPRE